MIRRIRLLRNIGQFDSVDAATITLGRLALIYAENGRGKTTLAAVLRSLASGDPLPITERRRLAATHPPYAVLDCDGGPPDAMFQDGAWNRTLPHLALFDDVFVDANIHSGPRLMQESGHARPEVSLREGAVVMTFGLRVQATGETPVETTGKTTGKTPTAVLRMLADEPNLSVPQLAARLGKSELTIHRAIRSLRESHRLVRIGPDKGGHWKVIE